MLDDPESIALRKEHVEWTALSAEARETLMAAEGICAARPFAILPRFVAWYLRWAVRKCERYEEMARIEARRTYGA